MSHTPWEVAADEICGTVEKASEKLIRRAADDFYQKLLDTTQDYLRDNTAFNLASELDAARRQAQSDCETATTLLRRIEELEAALNGLDLYLDFSEDVGPVWEFEDTSGIQEAFDAARAALSKTEDV